MSPGESADYDQRTECTAPFALLGGAGIWDGRAKWTVNSSCSGRECTILYLLTLLNCMVVLNCVASMFA